MHEIDNCVLIGVTLLGVLWLHEPRAKILGAWAPWGVTKSAFKDVSLYLLPLQMFDDVTLVMQDGEWVVGCSSGWWRRNTLSNMSDWDGGGRESDSVCKWLSESTSSSLYCSLWV